MIMGGKGGRGGPVLLLDTFKNASHTLGSVPLSTDFLLLKKDFL